MQSVTVTRIQGLNNSSS